MSSPVDLTNLREITDGDAAMERELFKEFIDSCDAYIVSLSTMLDESNNDEWRKTAHAFKGLALNLGAAHLGELCKNAQENNTADTKTKSAMLDSIKNEYSAVKDYLNSIS